MELVDVVDSKSTAGDSVPVRVRPPAPKRSASPTGMRTFLAWMVPTSKQWFDARPQAGVSERNRRLRRHLARRRRPPAPRRSKVRFAPTSFYACGKKDVIRPLPCSSFPTATRCAGLAVGRPPCGRHFSPLKCRFYPSLPKRLEIARFQAFFELSRQK